MDQKAQAAAAKEWLLRYRDAARDSMALDSRIAAMRSRIESARTSNLDGMPRGSGFEGDNVGAALSRLSELEDESRECRAHAMALYHEINDTIKRITGPDSPYQRAVLQMRYLDGSKWDEIAEMLFGDDPDDFDLKQDSYLRRVFKLHGAALSKLAELIPLDECETVQKG